MSDYDYEFFEILTIEVPKSFHVNLTVVKFNSIYTGSLDLHCSAYGMAISAIPTNIVTSARILVFVGVAIFNTIILSYKVECRIRNIVVDSKLHVVLHYPVAALSSLMYVSPDLLFAQSKFQEFSLNSTSLLYSFQQPFKISRISIDATYDKQIYIKTYVNRDCTDFIAATKLFDGPLLRYNVMICKTNSSLVGKGMVQLFSHLGTYSLTITYLEDTTYTESESESESE